MKAREGDVSLVVERGKLTTRVNLYYKDGYVGTMYLPPDVDIRFETETETGTYFEFRHLSLVVNGIRTFGTVSMIPREESEDV